MTPRDPSRNPFEGVTDYFSELSRMRQLGSHGRDPGPEDRQRTHASAWVPATDIFVREEDLVVLVELAGVPPDSVDLRFSHGVLTVSGSRPTSPGADDAGYYVRERFYGEFRRAVTLPDGTEADQISAVFADGLVEITVEGALEHEPDSARIELRDGSTAPTSRTVR